MEVNPDVLLESMVDGVLVVDQEGIVRYANPSATDLFSHSTADLIGAHLGAPLARGSVEIRLPPEGEFRVVEMRSREISWSGGTARLVNLRDVTEHRRIAQELLDLNQELEARVAVRTAELKATIQELETFSYAVSHDLQAPLRGIAGLSSALAEDFSQDLSPGALDYLQRIRAETRRVQSLIQALLGLSRVTTRRLRPGSLNLSDMAREILEGAFRDGAEVSTTIIHDTPTVEGDRVLLRQVLENLLHNAWKFTEGTRSPRVEVGADVQEGTTVFYVQDNGVGFDPRYADKLFAPFQRLHTQEEFPGAGIGLSTVQRILKRHGGDIWFESASGEGATFYFTVGGPRPDPRDSTSRRD